MNRQHNRSISGKFMLMSAIHILVVSWFSSSEMIIWYRQIQTLLLGRVPGSQRILRSSLRFPQEWIRSFLLLIKGFTTQFFWKLISYCLPFTRTIFKISSTFWNFLKMLHWKDRNASFVCHLFYHGARGKILAMLWPKGTSYIWGTRWIIISSFWRTIAWRSIMKMRKLRAQLSSLGWFMGLGKIHCLDTLRELWGRRNHWKSLVKVPILSPWFI